MKLTVILLVFCTFLIQRVTSKPGGDLKIGGVNVCTKKFSYNSYVYQTLYYTGYNNYETCCKRFIFCISHCTKYKTIQKKQIISLLKVREATSKFCCPGYARTADSPDQCPQAICKPRCLNGNCVKPNECKCKDGFTGRYCETEIDECISAPCEQTCNNIRGSYSCSCKRGFRKMINQTIGEIRSPRCENIDECEINKQLISKDNDTTKAICQCAIPGNNCKATCVNTIGSYKCQCSQGFRLVANRVCTDVDECRTNKHNCDQICINKRNGFSCFCYPGYKLAADNRTCVDMNECLTSNGGCEQECTNTIGSFRCSCKKGYFLKGDEFRCEDVNECRISRPCDQFNWFCVNHPGAYECKCNPGFELNYDRKTCRDINECNRINDCEQNCFNLDGSYTCGCRIGYKLRKDGTTCEDVDECAEDINGCDQLCENVPGSYKCKCKPGYMLDFDGKSCLGVPCPKLQAPYRGSVTCTGRQLGDQCKFSCNAGYELVGDHSTKCLNGSIWAKNEARCIPEKCSEARPMENGILTQPCLNSFESTCLVRCQKGYDIKGSHQIHCRTHKNRTMYWDVQAKCDKIDLCSPNPCKRGVCRVLSRTTFHCDCSNTGYVGKYCHIGVIKVPELPQLTENVESDFMEIQARPLKDLIFTLVAEPPESIEFIPSNVLPLYSPKSKIEFQIRPKQRGILRIKYQLTGTNSIEFIQPADSLVLVQPAITSEQMTTLPKLSFMNNNCNTMKITQCEGRQIVLKSNCQWQVSGSRGYVSINDQNLNLPFSVAGISFLEKNGLSTFSKTGILTAARETQNMLMNGKPDCDLKTKKCAGVYFNKADHDFMIKRNLFAKSYINQILKETPWWLTMSLPFLYPGFHANDVQSLLVRDFRTNDLKCVNKPSNMQGLFSAMIMQAPLNVQIKSTTIKMESLYHTCLFKSLCNRGTFISFPLDVSKVLSIDGTKMVSVEINGIGVSVDSPLSDKCVDITDAISGNVQNVCIKGNTWMKGFVNLTTSHADIKFNGEIFIESKDTNKAVLERFSEEHKMYMGGKATAEFYIPVHGRKLGLLFRDKPTEISALIGGKEILSSCSQTCQSKGVHFSYDSSHLELDYRTSVLRLQPNPASKISTHVHYSLFNGAVTSTNVQSLTLSNLKRRFPSLMRGFKSYARPYPTESKAMETESALMKTLLDNIQTKIKGNINYQDLFTDLASLRRQGMALMDAVIMFKDTIARKSPSRFQSVKRIIKRLQINLGQLYNSLITANVAKTTEVENGLSIRYTGKVCIYQLCFDNSNVAIQHFQSGCTQCDAKISEKFVQIKAISRKTRQLSGSIKMPSGGVTMVKLSKEGMNDKGEVYITSDAVVSFFGNTYNVTIYVNQTLMYFNIYNVTAGDDQFDINAQAVIDPTTTWKKVRFYYHGIPSDSSKLSEKLLQKSDGIILKNVLKVQKRIENSQQILASSKKKFDLYEKETEGLKKIYKAKDIEFKKAESDYKRNKTEYEKSLAAYRSYFSLDFLKQIQSNLSQVCKFKKCQDTCHTMRLYDICQKPKPIEAEEMRCLQERMVDRTTVLETFETLCALTKYNFKKIYTGTCEAGKEEKLQSSLIAVGSGAGFLIGAAVGGPVGAAIGAGIGALVGFFTSMFSSCDTSFETLKIVNNYQEACSLKKSVTKTKEFFVSECLPFPITVLSGYDTPYRCMVSNTSCIYITDGSCLYDNNECKKKQDIKRRNMMEHVGAYNEYWSNLNLYETKLNGLLLKKHQKEKAMVEAKRQYERKKAVTDAEKLKKKFAQDAIDNVGVVLSLEKCFLDFYIGNGRKNKSILSYSDVKFKTRLTSVESLFMEMIISGDDRQGKQVASFILSFDDNGISFTRGVRKMVQYYLCKRHSRKRRSITERLSFTPLGRHDDQRNVALPDNVTDHNVECLHAKTIFGYVGNLLTSLLNDIEENIQEEDDLAADLSKIKKTIAQLDAHKSDELVQKQIEILNDLRNDGLKATGEISSSNILSQWEQKMEIYTKSYNFTSCLGLKDCLNVAMDNLLEFPSTHQSDNTLFINDIRKFETDFNSFLQDDNIKTLKELKEALRLIKAGFESIKKRTLYCESVPSVKLISPIQIDTFKGEKVLLRCKVQSKAKFTVHWSKDDELLPFETEETMAIYIDESSTGHYRCIARNKAGNASSNATHIVLQRKPVIIADPQDFTYLSSDRDQKKPFFYCNVSADPVAKIAWYFQPFSQGSSLKLSTTKPVLSIDKPTTNKAGYYYCFASNKFGHTQSKKARLEVLITKTPQQDMSVSFDVSFGNIENVNKTELDKDVKVASRMKQNQKLEMNIEPSGEKKVKFMVNFEENDVEPSNIAVRSDTIIEQDNIMMIKAVSNKRQSLSEGLTRVVSKIADKGNKDTARELQGSAVLGFDGNKCQTGFQLHTNGFACVPCAPGSYEWNRVCLLCPVGKYQSSFGTTKCNECQQSKVTENVGATSAVECVKPALKSMDIVFVLEASAFLSTTEFQNLVTYITNFYKSEVSATGDVQFGVVSFAKTSSIEVPLTSSRTAVIDKLKKIKQKKDKNVEIHSALQMASNSLKQQNRRRVIIALSKNPSTTTINLVRNTAMQLQNNGIQTINIAVGPSMGHEALVLASRPKAINILKYKDTTELKNTPSGDLASTILRGECGSPEIDVGMLIESNVNTREKVWEVALNFIKTLTKEISKRSYIDMGLVSFDQHATPLINATHKNVEKVVSALGKIQATSSKVDVVSAMEFVVNRYLTEEYGFENKRKIMIVFSNHRVSDDQITDINRLYSEESVLILNVLLKYQKQDLGVSQLGVEESMQSVFSLSELVEVKQRIMRVLSDAISSGCHVNNR